MLPVTGIPISEGRRAAATADEGPLERAWRRISTAMHDLFSLRRVGQVTTRLVTQEEQSLRRQHLELLLAAARIAAMQNDAAAYTQALHSGRAMARSVLRRRLGCGRGGAPGDRCALTMSVQAPHPAIGTSAQLLRRLTPTAQAAP
jgi:hypothetical protein